MKMRLCALFSTLLLGSAIAAWAGSCNLPLAPVLTSGGACNGNVYFHWCTKDSVKDGGCGGKKATTRCRPLNATVNGNTYDSSGCNVDIDSGNFSGSCTPTATTFGSFKGQTIPGSSCATATETTATAP